MTFLVSSPEGIQVSMLCVGFAVALCPPFRWSMYLGRNLEDAFLAATQWPLTNKPPRQFSLTYLRMVWSGSWDRNWLSVCALLLQLRPGDPGSAVGALRRVFSHKLVREADS